MLYYWTFDAVIRNYERQQGKALLSSDIILL